MLRKWFWLFNLIAALIVRFLTKRYIGEYDHQTENRYKHEAMVDGEPVLFEILDTCPKVNISILHKTLSNIIIWNIFCFQAEDEYPNAAELVQWADGLLLVYSITDIGAPSVGKSGKNRKYRHAKCFHNNNSSNSTKQSEQ